MELEVYGEFFEDTPVWWKNYLNSFPLYRKSEDGESPGVNRLRRIRNRLQLDYKAVMLYNDTGFYALKFTDPKYSTKFLLDWS